MLPNVLTLLTSKHLKSHRTDKQNNNSTLLERLYIFNPYISAISTIIVSTLQMKKWRNRDHG